MRVVDPGHVYELAHLDEDKSPTLAQVGHLRFVKRVGAKFPGNAPPAHPGTTTQEVIRALIDRAHYVDAQDPDPRNGEVVEHLRQALYLLEERAAQRRGERLPKRAWRSGLDGRAVGARVLHAVEDEPTCRACGHIRCGVHQ